jgi:hypothetical protein
MTFSQAREWLRSEAQGRPFDITYGELYHSNGKITRDCRMMILEGNGMPNISVYSKDSWDAACEAITALLHPESVEPQEPQDDTTTTGGQS